MDIFASIYSESCDQHIVVGAIATQMFTSVAKKMVEKDLAILDFTVVFDETSKLWYQFRIYDGDIAHYIGEFHGKWMVSGMNLFVVFITSVSWEKEIFEVDVGI